jgi:hypothetical protein
VRKVTFLVVTGILLSSFPQVSEAAPKKKCSANQEILLLDLDRRLLSIRKIASEQNLALEVNQELLSAAVATNNSDESSRIGLLITRLRQQLDSNQKVFNQISAQKSKILKTCTSKAGKGASATPANTKALPKCSTNQLELIEVLAQQHESTLSQIQDRELEIMRQRKLAKFYISQGRNSQAANANYEIQRQVAEAGDLSAYASIIKRQFEVANSSCANSNMQLSDLLSRIFVPNSLIAMNINRFESVNKELTRPILSSTTGNLTISCDETSSDSSAYSTVGIYFAFTTKKPEIWDRYNGAGVDSDSFTRPEFQPVYLKEPDSTFTLTDFKGTPMTFKGFKADVQMGSIRDVCEFEIVPVNPSTYVSNAAGIWYFVIAKNQSASSTRTTIWSLSGFTLPNYLNPLRY